MFAANFEHFSVLFFGNDIFCEEIVVCWKLFNFTYYIIAKKIQLTPSIIRKIIFDGPLNRSFS